MTYYACNSVCRRPAKPQASRPVCLEEHHVTCQHYSKRLPCRRNTCHKLRRHLPRCTMAVLPARLNSFVESADEKAQAHLTTLCFSNNLVENRIALAERASGSPNAFVDSDALLSQVAGLRARAVKRLEKEKNKSPHYNCIRGEACYSTSPCPIMRSRIIFRR